MTRRERLQRKVERRQEWAAGRTAKADGLDAYTDRFRGDHAFNTQPGHIPERARVIRMTEKSFEHRGMAQHHKAKAAGLADQLATSIYSDDSDAVGQLELRIAELVAVSERRKAINKEIKKGPGWMARLTAAGITPTEEDGKDLESVARHQPYYADKKTGLPVFPAYDFSNRNGNIGRLRKRLEEVKRQAQQQEAAEKAPGGVLIQRGEYVVSVRFAEKPDRSVINALKAAGFLWGTGSWGVYNGGRETPVDVPIEVYNMNPDLCPICGVEATITGLTTDGRLIGSCSDAFTRAQWEAPADGSDDDAPDYPDGSPTDPCLCGDGTTAECKQRCLLSEKTTGRATDGG